MSKIKVLVLPSDKTGVGKFRSVDPHVMLQNNHSDEFHVDIDYEPKINDLNYITLNNLGLVYLNLKKLDLAILNFNKALQINQNYAKFPFFHNQHLNF